MFAEMNENQSAEINTLVDRAFSKDRRKPSESE
jgi:hypothetical protein